MIPSYIRGCIAPVFSAFNEDGSFDPDGQRSILQYLVDHGGVSAYFVRCGMGQMFTFSADDVRAIVKTSCDVMAGKGPVLAGTSGAWDRNLNARPGNAKYIQETVELSRYAEDCGAAGIVLTVPEAIVPEGNETVHEAILRYFDTVAAAVKLPIFIYQSPGTLPEYCVTPKLLADIADRPGLIGIKVSTDAAAYIFALTYAVRGKDFAYVSGNEMAFLHGLITGSRAVIGQGATVNPKILVAIQERYERGDLAGAIEAQRSTNILCECSKGTTEFFKRYITEKGYPVKPYHRAASGSLYAGESGTLTQAEYETFKGILEAELAKY